MKLSPPPVNSLFKRSYGFMILLICVTGSAPRAHADCSWDLLSGDQLAQLPVEEFWKQVPSVLRTEVLNGFETRGRAERLDQIAQRLNPLQLRELENYLLRVASISDFGDTVFRQLEERFAYGNITEPRQYSTKVYLISKRAIQVLIAYFGIQNDGEGFIALARRVIQKSPRPWISQNLGVVTALWVGTIAFASENFKSQLFNLYLEQGLFAIYQTPTQAHDPSQTTNLTSMIAAIKKWWTQSAKLRDDLRICPQPVHKAVIEGLGLLEAYWLSYEESIKQSGGSRSIVKDGILQEVGQFFTLADQALNVCPEKFQTRLERAKEKYLEFELRLQGIGP